MGWNFRKSIRVGKGVRVNLSKSGIGVSAGVKGFRVGANKRGVYTSQSIPGTGLYKQEYIAKSPKVNKREQRPAEPAKMETITETIAETTDSEPVVQKPRNKRKKGCLTVLAILFIFALIGSLSGIRADQAKVLSVLAVDQIRVRYASGSEATIQLAGIDRAQGEDATALNYAKTALVGQTVYIQKTKADKDAGFIWTAKPRKADDSEIREAMFNAALLLNGHAEYSPAGVDDKYGDSLKACETEAKQAQIGLWTQPTPPPQQIAEEPAPEPKPEPTQEPTLEPTKSSEQKEPAKEPAKDPTAQTASTSTPSSAGTPVTSAPKVEQPKTDPKEIIVYIADTGTKYHRATCRHVKKSKTSINLEDALNRGYTPCKVCEPPR